jgi:hypothetical protein
MEEEQAKRMAIRAYPTKPRARRDMAQAIRRALGHHASSNH